jgi:hypothetical protein
MSGTVPLWRNWNQDEPDNVIGIRPIYIRGWSANLLPLKRLVGTSQEKLIEAHPDTLTNLVVSAPISLQLIGILSQYFGHGSLFNSLSYSSGIP